MRILQSLILHLVLMSSISICHATLLSQTVARVGESIISTRDVQIHAMISGSGELEASEVKSEPFKQALSATILEAAVQKEAENFQVAQIPTADLEVAVKEIIAKTKNKELWKKLDVTESELQLALKRQLSSKKFIKIKTDSMTTLVTDQEAYTYFEKNRLKFGQLPFSNFKDNIKNFLTQQQLEERLKSWFELIKRKYKVRNYLSETKGEA